MIWVNPQHGLHDWIYVFDGTLQDWKNTDDLSKDINPEQAFREFGYRTPAGEAREWCIENKIKRVPLLDGSWKPSPWQRAVPFRIVPQGDAEAVLTKLRWVQGR
jgi:hypothetical protein